MLFDPGSSLKRQSFHKHSSYTVLLYTKIFIPPIVQLGGILESVCLGVCLEDFFWTVQPFVTKPGMVVHHHELACRYLF